MPAAGSGGRRRCSPQSAIIVSRELGIRASSRPPTPRRIPDGSRIRVDGSTGAVTVLELA
ncbi:MAG: hypothetical protein R2713_00375 [Ilumatobacteraceae bacterium]